MSADLQAAAQTVNKIKVAAQRWYDRELKRCASAYGENWPATREWVQDYLRAELRQRLVARGWRAHDQHR